MSESADAKASESEAKKKKDEQPSSAGYTRSASASAPKPPTAHAAGNRLDREISAKLQKEQAQASRQAYEANKAKFQAPPVDAHSEPRAGSIPTKERYESNPTYTSTRVYGTPSYEDVHIKRRTVYRDWNPPVVVYRGSSSYGTWDAMFLWWALQHDPLFGYHHRNDASYRAWRRDAERLSRENEVLRQQLLEQDRQNLRYESERLAHNARYLPAAVSNDSLLALSDEAIKTLPVAKPLLRVATGVEGGKYHQIGETLRAKAGKKFDVELVQTSGAAENLKLLQSGKVDAAIVQSDTQFVTRRSGIEASGNGPEMLEATIYCEYVMLVVGKDSSITSVKDLKSGNTVYVGPEGSGTAVTWTGLAMQNDQYKGVKAERLDYQAALDRFSKDPTAALLFVAGSDAPLLRRAENSGKFRLVPVDDDKLDEIEDNKGNEVYSSLLIAADAYPGLHKGELQTLAVEAVWTLSESWIKRFGDPAFDNVNYVVKEVISDLHIGSLKASAFKPGTWLMWGLIALIVCCGGYWFLFKFNATKA